MLRINPDLNLLLGNRVQKLHGYTTQAKLSLLFSMIERIPIEGPATPRQVGTHLVMEACGEPAGKLPRSIVMLPTVTHLGQVPGSTCLVQEVLGTCREDRPNLPMMLAIPAKETSYEDLLAFACIGVLIWIGGESR